MQGIVNMRRNRQQAAVLLRYNKLISKTQKGIRKTLLYFLSCKWLIGQWLIGRRLIGHFFIGQWLIG